MDYMDYRLLFIFIICE